MALCESPWEPRVQSFGEFSSTGQSTLGASGAPAIEYSGVTFAYGHADTPAIKDVTLAVHEGERLGVLGPNGGGKSTLLKLTMGLLSGNSGSIRVLGMTPQRARRARVIGYVPQRHEGESRFPVSGFQVVLMASASRTPWYSRTPKSAIDAAREAIDAVGASRFCDRPIGTLSGGQVQRIMIARALSIRPRILILDEPLVGVDVAGQQQFADLLANLHRTYRLTTVVVSHDIRTIAAGSDTVACLARTLHSHTAPSGLTPEVLGEVFRHDVAAIFGDVHVHAHAADACNDPSHSHPPNVLRDPGNSASKPSDASKPSRGSTRQP